MIIHKEKFIETFNTLVSNGSKLWTIEYSYKTEMKAELHFHLLQAAYTWSK
jgi:hypothetical protein